MMSSNNSLPPSNAVLTAAASIIATVLFLRSAANDLLPEQIQKHLSSLRHKLTSRLSSLLTILLEESDGLTSNQMFHAANAYLSTKISPATVRIKAHKPEKDREITVTVDKNQEIVDVYDGVRFTWTLHSTPIKQNGRNSKESPRTSEFRHFELCCRKKHRVLALGSYLPYVLKRAKEIGEETRTVRLHTVDYNGTDYWGSAVLSHPANFDTMAMDLNAKRGLIEDLDRFVNGKDYYKRVGKAWKRGYLLYGPPGTGKSSLVAAMANYLKFDVYDLDLREVQCNSDLRRLLIGSANKSILVIEDIDCNVGLQSRENENVAENEDDKITLSGLLNFIDGLWSSCGDERIIVFTTNHKNRLDPALLRPGRMDVHIEMPYCAFDGFKILARNYLRIDDHVLFPEVEKLLAGIEATPAEVAGELMKSEDADVALQSLIKFLQDKEQVSKGSQV